MHNVNNIIYYSCMLVIFCANNIYIIIKHNIVLKSRHSRIYAADIIILYACKRVYVCISRRHYSYTLADTVVGGVSDNIG